MVGILGLVFFTTSPSLLNSTVEHALDCHFPPQPFPTGIYKKPLNCSWSKNLFTATNSQQVRLFKKILSNSKHSQRYVKFFVKVKKHDNMTKNLMPLEQAITNSGQELLPGLLDISALPASSWKRIPSMEHWTAATLSQTHQVLCISLPDPCFPFISFGWESLTAGIRVFHSAECSSYVALISDKTVPHPNTQHQLDFL